MEEREILEAAKNIFDGWYANESRIDWQDFIDRLEQQTDHDFGNDMNSRLIRKVKAHIREYRKL